MTAVYGIFRGSRTIGGRWTRLGRPGGNVYMPNTSFVTDRVSIAISTPGRQEGGDHRRAIQWRRRSGDGHHEALNAKAYVALATGDARRGAAAGGDLRAEGDDRESVRRFRGRCNAVVFPAGGGTGKLVGKRTWGGLIGRAQAPSLKGWRWSAPSIVVSGSGGKPKHCGEHGCGAGF